ncbi:hypothetical protein F6455_10080 [Proteobacteria bacterium 005FR1]|nr:hypothetical protein [Proteobacteria bacterium 005FR1]
MDLPFSTKQFFEVFALYNEAVWPAHLLLRALAFLVLILVFVGQRAVDRTIMAILSLFWLWMGLLYHFTFFTAINPAAWVFGAFFIAQGLLLFWKGVVKSEVRFDFRWSWRDVAGVALIMLSLIIYPLLSFWVGERYPAAPTFGLPCPTAIFTLGVLLIASPLPRLLFVIPLLWTLIGSVAAFELGVHQDLLLLLAALLAVAALLLPQRSRTA